MALKFNPFTGTFDIVGAGASAWLLAGNTGNSGGEFLGTTDARQLDIRTNNILQIQFNSTGKGWYAPQTITPVDGASLTQFNHQVDVIPTADTATASHGGVNYNLTYDGSNAGHDFGGQLNSGSVSFNHGGNGNVAGATVLAGSIGLTGPNGSIDLIKGYDMNVSIGSGYTVDSLYNFSSTMNVQGATILNGILYNANAVLDDCTLTNFSASSLYLNITGVSTAAQPLYLMNGQITVTEDTVTNGLSGCSLGATMSGNAATTNINGNVFTVSMADNAVATSITALSGSALIQNASQGGNIQVIASSAALSGTASSTGLSGMNSIISYSGSATGGHSYAFNTGVTASDNASVDSLQGANISIALSNSAHADSLTGINVGVNMNDASTADNFTAINASTSINNTAALTNGYQGIVVGMSSSTPVSSATGISVSMTSVSCPTLKTAISVAGGRMNIQYDVSTADVTLEPFVYAIHAYQCTLKVEAGSPITGAQPQFGFMNNFGGAFWAADDVDADFTGIGIGHSFMGTFGQVAVETGKTVADFNQIMVASSIPAASTGGIVTNLSCVRTLGVVPDGSGGTLQITNLYGFKVDSVFTSASPTNAWGVFVDDANCDNYFARSIAIGTSTKKVANSDVGFEIGNNKALLNGRGSTAQRNAITAIEGMQFADTDLNKLFYYDGTQWVDLRTPGPTTEKSGRVTLAQGATTRAIVFNTPWAVGYVAKAVLLNTTLGGDMNVTPVSVIQQSTTQVTFQFNATDDANYVLCWHCIEATEEAAKKAGTISLSSGDETKTITFVTAFNNPYTAYALLRNTVDADANLSPVSVIAQDLTSVTFKFNKTDSANYEICWFAIEDNDP